MIEEDDDILDAAISTFPGFNEATQLQLYYFMESMGNLAFSLSIYKRIIAILGIFLTIIHIIILSHKAMRKSSTNVIMIGLAISDIFLMIIVVIGLIQELTGRNQLSCDGPLTYAETVFLVIMQCFDHLLRRCTSWLAIAMAFIRAISIKKALDRRYDILHTSKCGWSTFFIVLFISFVIAIFHYFIYSVVSDNESNDWLPSPSCPDSPRNFTGLVVWYIDEDETLGPYYIIGNGVIAKLIPCAAFPILTAILMSELKKAKSIRKSVAVATSSEKPDKTTILVIYMAVSFMIAEMPQGLVKLVEFYFYESIGFMYITTYFTQIFVFIGFINAITHCFLCYAMSMKYRAIFNNLFRCKENKVSNNKPKRSHTISLINVISKAE